MRKKKYRNILYLKISFRYHKEDTKNQQIELLPVAGCKSQMYYFTSMLNELHIYGKGNFVYYRDSKKLCRALRRITIHEHKYVTLLFGIGDKDAANPCFWNETDDTCREEAPRKKEKVATTSHLLICTEYLPKLGGYLACVEEATYFKSTSDIKDMFNYLLRTNHIKLHGGEANAQVDAKIEVETLASHSFEEAMQHGRIPLEIIAQSTSQDKDLDNYFIKHERTVYSMKPKSQISLQQFISSFRRFFNEVSPANRFTIKFQEPDNTERCLPVKCSGSDFSNLANYFFIQREHVILNNTTLREFEDDIHPELNKLMMERLKGEENYIIK